MERCYAEENIGGAFTAAFQFSFQTLYFTDTEGAKKDKKVVF